MGESSEGQLGRGPGVGNGEAQRLEGAEESLARWRHRRSPEVGPSPAGEAEPGVQQG